MSAICHAVLQLTGVLGLRWFAEYEQVFVVNEQEVTVRLTLPAFAGAFHFPLHLNDILAQDKANFQKPLHDMEGDWNVVLMTAGVADENGTMATGFENAIALLCNFSHSIQIFVQRTQPREVSIHCCAF